MLILFVLQALQPDPVLSQNGPLVSYGEAVVAYLANHGLPWFTSRVEGLPPPPGLQASFMKSGPRVVQTGLSPVGCLEISVKFANPLASASSWQFIMVDKRHFDKDSISMSSVL